MVTIHSISKNPIGDDGLSAILDAMVEKPNALKRLGLVHVCYSITILKSCAFILGLLDVSLLAENFTSLLNSSKQLLFSRECSKCVYV